MWVTVKDLDSKWSGKQVWPLPPSPSHSNTSMTLLSVVPRLPPGKHRPNLDNIFFVCYFPSSTFNSISVEYCTTSNDLSFSCHTALKNQVLHQLHWYIKSVKIRTFLTICSKNTEIMKMCSLIQKWQSWVWLPNKIGFENQAIFKICHHPRILILHA